MLRSILGSLLSASFTILMAGSTSAADRNAKKPPEPTQAEIEAREHVHQALLAETLGDNTARSKRLSTASIGQPQLAEANWHLGRVQIGDKWLSIDDAEIAAAEDATLRKYRQQRDAAKNPKMLQALARWCIKTGWDDEAKLHYAQVLQSPDASEDMRTEAIKKLDLHQVNGSWLTGDEITARSHEAKAAHDAFVRWRPQLKSLQLVIDGEDFQKRDTAIAQLKELDDPTTIRVFESFLIDGGDRFQEEAVATLAEFPQEEATEALVRLSLFSSFTSVRSRAADALQHRPVHEYCPDLLQALVAPIQSRFQVSTSRRGEIEYVHAISRETPTAEFIGLSRQIAVPVLGFIPGRRQNVATAKQESERAQLSSALNAAEMLESFVRLSNAQSSDSNNRVFYVLERATNVQLPRDPGRWWQWWQEYNEYHWPKRVQYAYSSAQHCYLVPVPSMSCFIAGTPVRTQTGIVAIETIRSGDRVLAQDQDTGELNYKLVLRTTLRPPADMVKIKAGSEEISTTLGHPFWVNGHGWRMAKQLKEGDLLHSVGGAIRIDAVEPLAKQPAHNLVVADFNTYFVGNQGLLVHDNEYRKPTRAIVPGLLAD